MSTGSNPFEELERLFERMTRQFDDASRSWEVDAPIQEWTSRFQPMSIDLADRDDEYEVTAEVPGFERDEVDVRITDRTLRIVAEREESVDEEDADFLRQERTRESMERSIRLPDAVDADGATATMTNGVVTVTIPKVAAESGHSIDIE